MIRRPPRSTLFPYTTSSDLSLRLASWQSAPGATSTCAASAGKPLVTVQRSEEHTSELQPHVNLVCRLLLEKKKSGKPLSARSRPSNETTALQHYKDYRPALH